MITDRHLELIATQQTSNNTTRELAAELLATRHVARELYRSDEELALAVLQERERSQI